jgi:hypothetical protein
MALKIAEGAEVDAARWRVCPVGEFDVPFAELFCRKT